MSVSAFDYRNGYPVVVARPANPSKAIASAIHHKSSDDILYEQETRFFGYLSKDGISVLNSDGAVIDVIKPGDSLIGGPQFERPRAEVRN